MLAIWKNKNLIAYSLWPFSLIYRFIIFLRRKLFQLHLKKITQFSVPIIVVGNITLGGTGKTPLVIEIAQFLKKNGWRPGIISRGYMGKTNQYPCRVHVNSNPREVGDEPLLIARDTGCPTIVDPDRSRGIKTLLGKNNCNIILSDDGLQHLALDRDIEVVVIDGWRRFGNGFCLPAGPLREPLSRLKNIDFIVSKGKADDPSEYEMLLIPDHFYQLIQPQNKQNLDFFNEKKIHVVAGIGNPDQFFMSLGTLGLKFIEHPFPDHHYFKPNDFNYGNEAIIIMTEKDAVKCAGLVDTRIWCLKTKTKLGEHFFNAILKKIIQIQKGKKHYSDYVISR